jgi:CheY-like chemotaxis protein
MRDKPLILVVDDEESLIEIMSMKLAASGFDVAVAHNGKEAILQAAAVLPDLILMDIHMPDQTGTDAALAIKQNPKMKDIKIAFLTSLKEPWPAVQGDKKGLALSMGMEDYLEKTEDLDKNISKVREILARK